MIKDYVIGFFLAIFLTCVSFFLVFTSIITKQAAIAGIMIAGAIQIFVHLYYFLHLNDFSRARWNIFILVFTLLLVIFFIGGTVWVMFTLHQRMM